MPFTPDHAAPTVRRECTPRVHAEGICVGKKRVARLMKAAGLLKSV